MPVLLSATYPAGFLPFTGSARKETARLMAATIKYQQHCRDSIQPLYRSSLYISSIWVYYPVIDTKDITATWMLDLRGNNNGTLSSYISLPPNTSICRLEDIHQQTMHA